MNFVSKTLKTLPKENLVDITNEHEKVYKLEEKDEGYTITKQNKIFVVEGEEVNRILRKVNITDNESLYYLHKKLDEIGLNQELKKRGIKDGDTVKIGSYEMVWED